MINKRSFHDRAILQSGISIYWSKQFHLQNQWLPLMATSSPWQRLIEPHQFRTRYRWPTISEALLILKLILSELTWQIGVCWTMCQWLVCKRSRVIPEDPTLTLLKHRDNHVTYQCVFHAIFSYCCARVNREQVHRLNKIDLSFIWLDLSVRIHLQHSPKFKAFLFSSLYYIIGLLIVNNS